MLEPEIIEPLQNGLIQQHVNRLLIFGCLRHSDKNFTTGITGIANTSASEVS